MKAIILRKNSSTPELADVARPKPKDDEVLIRMIRCGLCGTDREIIRRGIADVPPDEDFLIMGHEALGQIEKIGPQVQTNLQVGDLVAIMVRRGCGKCNACQLGHFDYCYTGQYTERGIHKLHGFFAEYVTDKPEFLIKVPDDIAELGVLTEPMSVSAKAYKVASRLMGRVCFDGACSLRGTTENVLVAGHGPIGILAAMMLQSEGYNVYVLGRRQQGDCQRDFVESLGITYLDITNDADYKFAEKNNGFLLIIEATGQAELTFRLPHLLSRNGILVLTGVPRGAGEICLDGNTLMASLVRFNQTITGTVNAARDDFETAVRYLQIFKDKYNRKAADIITGHYNLQKWQEAFGPKKPNEIKAVIDFAPQN